MIELDQLKQMLKNAGISRFLLSRREKKALVSFLHPNETVEACSKGFYDGGKGILVATDQKLLLIDARLSSLYSRIITYDALRDIKFSRQLFDCKIMLHVDSKKLVFKSHSELSLGRLSSYVRGKILSQQKSDIPSFLDLLDQSAVFNLKKKILLPRHRHGKFPVSLH
jgi:hypothetical protein